MCPIFIIKYVSVDMCIYVKVFKLDRKKLICHQNQCHTENITLSSLVLEGLHQFDAASLVIAAT